MTRMPESNNNLFGRIKIIKENDVLLWKKNEAKICHVCEAEIGNGNIGWDNVEQGHGQMVLYNTMILFSNTISIHFFR